MSKKLSRWELARKLAEGAVALRNLQQNAQSGDSSDSPTTIVKKGFNLFSRFHSGGERVLIGLGYTSSRTDITNFKTCLRETIQQKDPFGLQVSNGCMFLILNPTRNVLVSLLLLIGTVIIAPHMPQEVYDNLRHIFQNFIGS